MILDLMLLYNILRPDFCFIRVEIIKGAVIFYLCSRDFLQYG